MTAYSMEEDRERFIKAGLDDYIAKPIKANSLIHKVKEWVRYEPLTGGDGGLQNESDKDLVLNQETLNQLAKYGGQELVESALLDFEEEATQLVRNTILHYKENNFDKMRGELHTLKGNSGTLGVEKLSTQAATIEKRLKENKFEGLKEELIKLNFLFKEFKDTSRNTPVPNE